MHSDAFATLRAWHPEAKPLVSEIEAYLGWMARDHPEGVIEEIAVAQRLPSSAEITLIRRLLVELVEQRVLSPLFQWRCPNAGGTVLERKTAREFPQYVDCDICGEAHRFSAESITVVFVLESQSELR